VMHGDAWSAAWCVKIPTLGLEWVDLLVVVSCC